MKKILISALTICAISVISILGYIYYKNIEVVTPDRKIMNIKENQKTKVYGVLNVPIAKNNMIWCGTLQLAWNELRDNLIKEDIKLDRKNTLVNELNKKSFDKRYLSKKDYIAIAGCNKDGIVDKVNRLLEEKFDEDDEWKISSKQNSPNDIVSYSFLRKNLQFKHAFENIKSGLNFNGVKVKAFGIYKTKDYEIKEKLSNQINVLYYNNDNNFIISLKGTDLNDELVLANMSPKNTLSNTLNYALTLINKSRRKKEYFFESDILKIPMIGFNINKNFKELENKDIANNNFKGYTFASVMQKMKFSLTEKGVQLKSNSLIGLIRGINPKPKKLIFSKPFLLYLKEKGDKKPYFAMWVDNSDIMLK